MFFLKRGSLIMPWPCKSLGNTPFWKDCWPGVRLPPLHQFGPKQCGRRWGWGKLHRTGDRCDEQKWAGVQLTCSSLRRWFEEKDGKAGPHWPGWENPSWRVQNSSFFDSNAQGKTLKYQSSTDVLNNLVKIPSEMGVALRCRHYLYNWNCFTLLIHYHVCQYIL